MRTLMLVLVFAMVACGRFTDVVSRPAKTNDTAVAAIRLSPSADANVALSVAISSALGNITISLSSNALTETSLLMIERDSHYSINGRVATGRMMERPEKLQLFLEGSQCLLVYERTGTRYPLAATVCAPYDR